MKLYREVFRIRNYEVDRGGVLKAAALLDYLQEAASNHAAHLGFGYEHLVRDKRAWLLNRLDLEIDRMPNWGETMVIETWPKSGFKMLALRDYRIYVVSDTIPNEATACDDGTLAEDAQLVQIGRATSGWVLLDTERRRPLRPTDHIRAELTSPDEHGIKEPPRKLEAGADQSTGLSADMHVDTRRSAYADIDVYQHTNNARLVQWMIDGLARQGSPAFRSLSVNFMAEVMEGDEVQVMVSAAGDEHTGVVCRALLKSAQTIHAICEVRA